MVFSFRYFAIYDFLSNVILFFKQFYLRFFSISDFYSCMFDILLLLCVCSLLFYSTSALVYAYESCFVVSSMYYQLSLGVD